VTAISSPKTPTVLVCHERRSMLTGTYVLPSCTEVA
jgi:hypothetical protein